MGKVIIVIFIIGFIVLSIFLTTLNDTDIINYVTIYGTYITICAFIITIMQIWRVRSISEETQISINKTTDRIKHILSVADFSKSIKTIEEIQDYIRNNRIELAILRLSEIKKTLICIKQNQEYKDFANSARCQELISQTGINLQSLRDHMETGKALSKSCLETELEQIGTLFIEIETSLKNKAYDTK